MVNNVVSNCYESVFLLRDEFAALIDFRIPESLKNNVTFLPNKFNDYLDWLSTKNMQDYYNIALQDEQGIYCDWRISCFKWTDTTYKDKFNNFCNKLMLYEKIIHLGDL